MSGGGGATAVNTVPLDPPSILARIKTVDGSGSGLDADLLDGQEGTYYRDVGNMNAGTLAVARGGTNLTGFTTGDILYASATDVLSKRAAGTNGHFLKMVAGVPDWAAITVSDIASGVLAAANGGTGVANTGTITNASNTTITGGGTLDLGGFTLTVPATGTSALRGTTNTFTAAQTISVASGTIFTVTGSGNAATRELIQSTSNGVSALAELRIENDQGSANRLSFALYSSGYSGTQWGTSLANAATLVQLGASPSALFIGANTATAPIIFGLGSAEVGRWTTGGSFLAIASTGGIGYGTGAGGTVSQSTSKSTGVTLNKVCGQITMDAASLGAGTSVSFTLTNSAIAASDDVHVSIKSGATADSYTVDVTAIAAGSCRIQVHNFTGGALAEALVLTFTVVKAVTA
jgi:hypothetical protein